MATHAIVLAKNKEDLEAVAKASGFAVIPGTEFQHNGIVTLASSLIRVQRALNYGPDGWAALARF